MLEVLRETELRENIKWATEKIIASRKKKKKMNTNQK